MTRKMRRPGPCFAVFSRSTTPSKPESSELKNLYDGVVVLDAEGAATVTLPNWFEALNADFRYQLTCIGGHAPVYIASEISQGRFRIAGGRPGLKVSWLVTGVRNDPSARANPLITEQLKSSSERGKYLAPEAHGRPKTDRIQHPSTTQVGRLESPAGRRQ